MRLLLDAHYSPRWIGVPLQQDGHDVRVATEKEMHGKPDDEVLEVAVAEMRILITADTRDFSMILQHVGDTGQSHFGVILVPRSIPNYDYGTLLRSIRAALQDTDHDMWLNRAIWLARDPT